MRLLCVFEISDVIAVQFRRAHSTDTGLSLCRHIFLCVIYIARQNSSRGSSHSCIAFQVCDPWKPVHVCITCVVTCAVRIYDELLGIVFAHPESRALCIPFSKMQCENSF